MVRTWKDVRLEANVRGELNAREDEGGHLQLVLRWEGCEEGRPPQLTLAWSQPLVDMQFAWHPRCGFDRSLRVDWAAPLATKVSSSAPVFCFYNAKGRNRLTVALSDAKTLLYSSLGVREEDGRLELPGGGAPGRLRRRARVPPDPVPQPGGRQLRPGRCAR